MEQESKLCVPTLNKASSDTQTILVVDDTPDNLALMDALLQTTYRVRVANNGERALELANVQPLPALILLDVMMPGMDGFTVLARLKADPLTNDIPVIFITTLDSQEDQLAGFDLGAADYITKPIMAPVVLARVRTHLELKQARDRLRDDKAWLEAEVQQRMKENELVQTVSIRALAHLAETRDPETGNHIHRTQGYIRLLANKLQSHPRFADFLTEAYIAMLVKSAPLHDIGKVGIPDNILLNPGKLAGEDWEVMKTHAKLGSDAIERAERDAEQPVAFLRIAKEIARWHHEKWDGSGYPDGLVGDAIPISARLMALADVFDALVSSRPYKPALPYERARAIIAEGKGRHFDPDVTDAFLAGFDEFVAIAENT
ncbi:MULTISPECIES: response regulator [Methylomonas]|uniref:response regulator n=1 Tax=Methylomonas TaxID=416 RepID=UPI001232CAC1|nr:two-component system response regulator [Methylomonas rhizoryzae]